jgi:flagellar protein FlbB
VAEFSEVSPGVRIFLLALLLVVLALAGVVWFDYLGLIDARDALAPVWRLAGLRQRTGGIADDDPNLLDKERLAKEQEALVLRAEDLERSRQELAAETANLSQIAEQLAERERAVEAREKAFNERVNTFENRRVNLAQNAGYLVGMRPQEAVARLAAMDDQDVIDIFRITEEEATKAGESSLVAYWLSLMDPERAAVLMRKMQRRSGG